MGRKDGREEHLGKGGVVKRKKRRLGQKEKGFTVRACTEYGQGKNRGGKAG